MNYTLTDNDKKLWKANSYLVKRGLFKDQIEKVSEWVDETAKWPQNMSKYLHFYEMDHPSNLSRIENFVPYHARLGQLFLSQEITDFIGGLMGELPVLYKDRINFKPPGGGAHSAHQDGVAYESGAMEAFEEGSIPYISILVSVDKATRANGCFEVVNNWNIDKLEILPMETPDPEHPNFSKISQKVEDSLEWIPIETEPGDVILFTERLPHRSAKNDSSYGRRILYGVYNPLSQGDKRELYYSNKRKNLNDPRYMVGNPHAPSLI
ncbi:phytanoyl-CoA dioxygenase family protein [Ekhidna sp.]|uniref:phytanoyl-CoA dioxygenase family protein n=1 Tax=Ekhidna sp. TaxID=2608089 RepID=UPI003BAA2F46